MGEPQKETEVPKERTTSVVLKEGFSHTHDGKELKPGDSVALTDQQLKAFGDKFRLSTTADTPPASPAAPEPIPTGPSSVVQDIGAKTTNPLAPVPDNNMPGPGSDSRMGGTPPNQVQTTGETPNTPASAPTSTSTGTSTTPKP